MLRPFPVGSGPRYQPGRNLGQPSAPTPSGEPSAAWFGRPSGPVYGPGCWPPLGPRPHPPAPCPPAPAPAPGTMPPLAPGALPPPVQVLELAAAYVPFQQFGTICPPGELAAPGTIFPELARTPPLYRWPPGTDGRV